MMQKIKSLEWADVLVECLIEPSKLALRFANSEVNIYKTGFIFPILSSGISILAMSVLSAQNGYFYYKISYGWILHAIISFLVIFISSGLTDMVFQFRGKRGNVKKIINILNFSYFPSLFVLPFVMFFTTLNFAAPFWFFIISLAALLWGLYIAARCLSELFIVDFFSALISYLLPFFLMLLAGVSSLLLSGFLIFGRVINL